MPYADKEKQQAAQRRYYEDNKALYATRNKIKRSRLRQHVIDVKSTTPCFDCSENFPYYIMDFDHRPGEEKIFEMSNLSNATSMASLLTEISKCDIVCANCHRHRTWSRSTGHSAL